MTDETDGLTDIHEKHSRWNRPAPSWYGQGWLVKLIAVITAALAVLCLAALIAAGVLFVAPSLNRLSKVADANSRTGQANAQVVRDLARATSIERAKDGCQARLNAIASDRSAAAIAFIARQNSAQWALFVAVTRQPRDPERVRKLIRDGGAVGVRAGKAAAAYDKADQARNQWVADNRPLPCPVPE